MFIFFLLLAFSLSRKKKNKGFTSNARINLGPPLVFLEIFIMVVGIWIEVLLGVELVTWDGHTVL